MNRYPMLDALFREIGHQFRSIRDAVVTREFWIYFGALLAIAAVGVGGAYFAIGFDNLSREKLRLVLACQTGQSQLGVIIVGAFVFCIAAFFALGEVAACVEDRRQARASGRRPATSLWRPAIALAGTLLVGVAGTVIMSFWCL